MAHRPDTRTSGPRLTPAWFIGLFALGLAARLPGLLFNGMADLDEIVAVWGAEVSHDGLAAAFRINYGLLSYAVYGPLYDLGAQLPRFWWAPYKAAEIGFEALVLAALLALLPARHRWAALVLYWLNPWFILHGAYQGFWEGPHLLMGLLAVLALRGLRDERLGWLAAGALLMGSAMFKPQGLAYFVVPVFIYLFLQALRGRWAALGWYAAGVAAVVVVGSAWIVALGGRWTALYTNYFSAVDVMPNLCNGCVNVWRTIVVALQYRLSQGGPTYLFTAPAWLDRPLHALAALASLTLIVLLAVRLPLGPTTLRAGWLGLPARSLAAVQGALARLLGAGSSAATADGALLVVMAYASLVIAQVGTRAHINHTYTALVLLIPLVAGRPRWLAAWLVMVAVQLYAHLVTYRLGRSLIAPEYVANPAAARTLLDNLSAAMATPAYPRLLAVQARLNDLVSGHLPAEPWLAALAFVQFLAAVYLIVAILRDPRPAPAPAVTAPAAERPA